MTIKERNMRDNDIPYPKKDSFIISKNRLWESSELNGKKIAENLNFYVRTDGNDSNTGIANSPEEAFRTIQKAVDTVCSIDIYQKTITINVADGTYNDAVILKPYVGGVSGSSTCNVSIIGNQTTPNNVELLITGNNCFTGINVGRWNISGFKLQTTGQACIYSAGNSYINITNCNFSSAGTAHLLSTSSGYISVTTSYNILGSAMFHAYCANKGIIYVNTGFANPVSGGLSFTSFIYCVNGGIFNAVSNTYPTIKGGVSPTGQRYTGLIKAIIDTGNGGSTYFPGSIAGSVSYESVYY